ncbi:MAG: sulfatase [Planctomycetota bacterium JB042]
MVPLRMRVVAVATMLAALDAEFATGAPAPRPNVVLILLDDLSPGDLGCYGGDDVRTPTLDRLAAEGRRFDRFYVHPVCSPTRVALLTGTHPIRSGVRRSYAGRSVRGLPSHFPTLAEVLRGAGYRTVHVGKWHLGLRKDRYAPTARGFDASVTDVRVSTVAPARSSGYHDPVLFVDDGPEGVPRSGHRTERLVEAAIRRLEEARDRPLFLNLWLHAPHAPLEPPPSIAARYPDTHRGRFAALLDHADRQIGRLIERIDRDDGGRGTLVLVLGDNGGTRGSHRGRSRRGSKGTVFEGGIRAPLLARWPGRIAAGSTCDGVVHAVDLLPTIASLAGADVSRLALDGVDLSAALDGRPFPPRRALAFWETKSTNAPTRSDERPITFAVRDGDWKLVGDGPDRWLFSLSTDPDERDDRLCDEPALAAELEQAYRAWRRRASRIALVPDRLEGAVTEAGGEWRFDGPGEVRFTANDLLDVADGDFTLSLRVTTDALGTEKQTIVERDGTFRLLLDARGRPKITLFGPDGGRATLRAKTPLPVGRPCDLVLTVFGRKKGASSIRLHVDGRVVDRCERLESLAPSEAPLVVGSSTAPFRGRIERLAAWSVELAPDP